MSFTDYLDLLQLAAYLTIALVVLATAILGTQVALVLMVTDLRRRLAIGVDLTPPPTPPGDDLDIPEWLTEERPAA